MRDGGAARRVSGGELGRRGVESALVAGIIRSPGASREALPLGVTGKTSDSGSEESRFEPWSDNKSLAKAGLFCVKPIKKRLIVDACGNPGACG